jgi:hypothetical protein
VSATSQSGGNDALRPRRTLAIFCESGHLLAQRVGLAVFEELKKWNELESVYYVPKGESLPSGVEVPDVLIMFDMPQLHQTGMQPRVSCEATFTAVIGDHFSRIVSDMYSNDAPTLAHYRANIGINYKATETGFETSGARYTTVSRDAAKYVTKQILDFLDKADGEPMPSRSLLAEFYPAFQPAPHLKVLNALKAVPVLEGPRFMQPTSAAWRFETNATPEEIKQLMEQELPESEWKLTWRDRKAETLTGIWSRGDERWLVEPAEQKIMTIAPPSTTVPIGPHIAPTPYFLIYTRTMGHDAIERAFARMLDREPNEAAMLPFRDYWHAHRPRIEQHFIEHPPSSAATLEALARWKLNDGDQEGARELVLRGWTIDRLFHEGQSKKEFEKLAKDCGIEQLPKTFDVSQLADLGVPDFRDVETMSLTAAAGDNLLILVGASEEEVRTLTLQVSRSGKSQWMLGHVANAIRTGSSSRGSSGPMPIDLAKPNSQWIGHWSVNVSVTPYATDDPETLGLRLGRSPQ